MRSHFIEMMSVLLHIRINNNSNEIGGYSVEFDEKDDWIALDLSRINELDDDDICRKFTLNESDYINLFNVIYPIFYFIISVFPFAIFC